MPSVVPRLRLGVVQLSHLCLQLVVAIVPLHVVVVVWQLARLSLQPAVNKTYVVLGHSAIRADFPWLEKPV